MEFKLVDESVGTGKLLVLGGIIIAALAERQVLIIDELDNSLHPKLTKVLVKLFNERETNPKKAQLVFTTHEVSLLENDLFRRDQVWLAEKEYQGFSHYYSLSDISGVRKDTPLEKWYMSGRFGATHVINEFFSAQFDIILRLPAVFKVATLNQQHSILNRMFKDGLTFKDDMFRTPSLNRSFWHWPLPS